MTKRKTWPKVSKVKVAEKDRDSVFMTMIKAMGKKPAK